ncbi:MAG: glucosamine-6-phosphate deaminase [Phycisphaerales bacterium]|nr:glucosamine-6-phosphate deaminase [Phycisphaerales bacterium]
MSTPIDYEKIPVKVFDQPREASLAAASEIAALIRAKALEGKMCVLGLATGSTPVSIYAELVRMHKQGGLSFKNVITFNLDEYLPMQPNELQSYHRFMHEHLFDHIDIDPKNINIPDGTLKLEDVPAYCFAYEEKMAKAGGLDLQLLGIGRTGHVGFNEPGSSKASRTRLMTLDRVTRIDAAGDFLGERYVPRRAITMGVGTILSAKRILLLAFGEGKASVIQQAVEGPVTTAVAASFLQEHPNSQILLDAAAAAKLTRSKTPWLVGQVQWDAKRIRTAAIWLALKINKPLLKLTDEDYNESGLQDLLAEKESAYKINLDVFRTMGETITGWPGGKPDRLKRPGDIARPTDAIFPKRCIIFSPHPDDDVISMGGTLIHLADQGHEVHIAYQTSGNLAVLDDDAQRFAEFAAELGKIVGFGTAETHRMDEHIETFIRNKQPGQADSPEIQRIKSLIRRGEARAAARECGVPKDRTHFLDMPFYETGKARKNPLSEADIKPIVDLLRKIKPHQLYAAGDLSDPHGTHRLCFNAILKAIEQVKTEPWFAQCEIWLYRGAWQEWGPEQIEMAVPLSPNELLRKRSAIFRHQSQKDRVMFPGTDKREFWQRAEDRNRATAEIYNKLGLAEYEAIEGFVRWHPEMIASK